MTLLTELCTFWHLSLSFTLFPDFSDWDMHYFLTLLKKYKLFSDTSDWDILFPDISDRDVHSFLTLLYGIYTGLSFWQSTVVLDKRFTFFLEIKFDYSTAFHLPEISCGFIYEMRLIVCVSFRDLSVHEWRKVHGIK